MTVHSAYGIIQIYKNVQKGLLSQRKRYIMKQDTIKKIHRWYGRILAAILVALGILFILSCLDIYTSGPRPYSADAIALRFKRIAIPVIIGVIGATGGIALNLLLPLESKRQKGLSYPEDVMLRLRQKANIPSVQKEMKLRLVYRLSATICFVVLMIYPLIYFLTPEHFSISELNADIVHAIVVVLIPTAVGLALCWMCKVLINKSFQREASIYKSAIAEGSRKDISKDTVPEPRGRMMLPAIRLVVAVAAVVFVILGIFNGGAEDVLKKAIAICTECIGLG